MLKLLFMSVLIAIIVLPIRAARSASAGKGLRRAVFGVASFNVLYWLTVLIGYFNLWIHQNPGVLFQGH